jgi:hypothetical protein
MSVSSIASRQLSAFVAALWLTSVGVAQTTRPAKTECQRAAEWCHETLVDGYEQHAEHHDAWDEPATRALAAHARQFANDPRQTGDEMDEVYFGAKGARDAGCRDPLVYYVAARNSREFQRKREEWIAFHLNAAHAIEKTNYHPFWKSVILLRTALHEAQAKNDPGSVADARRLFDAGRALVPGVLVDESVPQTVRAQLFKILGEASFAVEGSRESACAQAFAAADPKLKDRSFALGLTAGFYVDHAWDARGSGFADSVTDDGWKKFFERLKVGAQAGEEAWKLDPTNCGAAQVMMWASLGLEDKQQRRVWFERAAALDPHNMKIYRDRLRALGLQWGGTPREMIEFGRECLRAGNWEAGIPFILVEAHLELARHTPQGTQRLPQAQYFRDNSQAWEDVKAVYDQYFALGNPSIFHRSRFAEIALWAGKYDEAQEQFTLLGDEFSYGWFQNDARYKRARAELDAHMDARR